MGFARPTPKVKSASAAGGSKTEAPMAVDPESCKGLPVSSASDSAGFALLEPCASSDAYELHELQTPTERADPSQASPCFGELMALDSCDSLPDKSQSMPLLEILK